MRFELVLLAAGGALVGYGLYRALGSSAPREAEAPTGPAPVPTYGEPKVASPFPAGYRRLKQTEVTPPLTAAAVSIRSSPGFTDLQYGTVIPVEPSTAALVEQHYHEPGGAVKPWGYHHGVTLIRRA